MEMIDILEGFVYAAVVVAVLLFAFSGWIWRR
jgi:hypothetical protein